MKKSFLSLFAFLILVPILLEGQSYIDPTFQVEAKVFTYKLETAPTIDASESEWSNIPWSEVRYNDRDFNSDNLIDPMSSRLDYRVRGKSAWVDGSNKIYFLYEIFDDVMFVEEDNRASHRDNLSIRLDPYDEEIGGEPQEGEAKNSFSIRFQTDTGENTGFEGNESAKPGYVVMTNVDDSQSPIRTIVEVELTLPADVQLSEGYVMGYYPLFADNDPEDDSPDSKNTVPMQWPQMYSELGDAANKTVDNKLLPDVFWRNDFWWGNIECITLNEVDVAAAGSIQSAVDAASEGTIIKLEAGTYTENITISTPYIQLVGSEGTILKAADVASPIITIANDDVAYGVVIKDIEFDGAIDDSTMAVNAITIGSAQAEILGNQFTKFDDPILKGDVDSTKAHACTFEDNKVLESNGGINFNTPNTYIRYNTIEENTGSYGVNSKDLIADNSVDIAFNTIFNHHGECAIGYGGKGTFTIHHNMAVRSETLYGAGDSSGDDGFENQDAGGSQDYIYNNTIVGWKSDGLQMGNGTSDFYVRNNLIAFCAGNDYDIRDAGSTDIDYGLSFGNGTDGISTLGSVAIVTDPSFTNELEDDFTITDASPAVDAGLTEPFGFKVMYNGEGLDIGAFETGTPLTDVEENVSNEIPNNYALSQNYPNPFNPTTAISFSIPKTGIVTVKVFNILGQEVATLLNNELTSGVHKINFDASMLSSGIYMYSIQAGDFLATKKMMLLK